MWEVFTGGKTGYAQNKQKMIDFDDELEWDHGEGSGNPLQYSCLEYPMDKAAWWAAVHGVAKNWTWLSDQTHTRRMRPRAEATHWHISDIFLLVSFHNVLAQQDETKFFLPSFSPSIFFFLILILRLPLQFQICFTCHQIACPISEAPRIFRCVPQGIWEIKYAHAPGTTASTGQSSLCSSHLDDFLFKIHLEGIV